MNNISVNKTHGEQKLCVQRDVFYYAQVYPIFDLGGLECYKIPIQCMVKDARPTSK